MARRQAFDSPRDHRHGRIDRRLFLGGAGRLAVGGLDGRRHRRDDGAHLRLGPASGKGGPRGLRPPSDRLRTRFMFQISERGHRGAGSRGCRCGAGGRSQRSSKWGRRWSRDQGVLNVVPAFRRRLTEAILLADMKTMDGGGGEARSVYAGGGRHR